VLLHLEASYPDSEKVANWIIAFTTPILLAKSSFGAYFFFGFASLLTMIVCLIAMPETKGRSLETIEQSFKQPSSSWSLDRFRGRKFAQIAGMPTSQPAGPDSIELEHASSSAMRPMVLRGLG